MSTEVMSASSPSAIKDLNRAIENQNPFDRSLVVRSHDVWEQHFPDVPSINSHISDAVFQGIEQIRRGQRQVLGITIRAEKGLGKSHLISRIRHRLKHESGAFFVYMSETDYTDLDRINSQFLNTLAFSLKQAGSQDVTQWQELASALINHVYKSETPTQQILNRFPGIIAKKPQIIDELTAKICQLKPSIQDPYIIQAILWTLSPARSMFAANWLSGKDLAQTQADAMGLPASQDGDKEARALSLASQILDLIGDYRDIVICFDEVEPKGCNSQGLSTPQVVSLLAKDLYSKLKRGILMMAVYPQTWAHQVKVMPQAESVTDRIGERVFDLKYLNSDDIITLVSQWLKDFYEGQGLTPPDSVYPFNESELRELGKEKPIVRRVLQWCSENWQSGTVVPPDPLHKVEMAFNEQLSALDSNTDDYLENSNLLANALWLGFCAIEGKTIGKVSFEFADEIETKSADRGYLHFKAVGQEEGKLIKIGVAVVQESGSKYVSAALKRLVDYEKFGLTRGCLVRSKAVKDGTKGADYLNQLLSKLGGEWVLLKSEDIKPLLAILIVFQACQEYEVTEDQVFEFMEQRKIAENNYLINEILSDPSGQVPHDLIDEDQVDMEEIKTTISSTNGKVGSIDDLLGYIDS